MPADLSPKILGQLVLIQSVVSQLPDQESVVSFLCRGLSDVPGVVAVEVLPADGEESRLVLAVRSNQHDYCRLRFQLDDEAAFGAYMPFVQNVVMMVGTILEERRQRFLNLQLMEDLERKVVDRTRELEREKRRVEQYLENIEVILVVLDDEARIRLINRRGCDVLGRSAEELIGKNWFSTCLPSEEAEEVLKVYRDLVENPVGFIDYYENNIVNRFGERRFVAWHNTRLVDDQGGFIGVLSSGEDITERRKAVNALAASEENLRITVDSIGDGVISTDTACNITRMNRVAEDLTGWKRADAIGKPLVEVFRIIAEKDRKPAKNPAVEVLRTGQQVGLANHTILLARHGREYQIADSAAPIRDEAGQIAGVVLVFRDVTDQYILEAEALKAEKLKSLGLLAGGIAHDFNNMLTSLFGNIELLRLSISTDHQAMPFLDAAIQSIGNAKKLTRQLLTFAKGGEPVNEAVDFATSISETVRLHLRGSSVDLHLDLAEDLWKVEADHGQLDQVMSNLVINAKQAMPEGGHIWITACNEMIQGAPFVRIQIKDSGHGISPDHLPRIFDPYFTTKLDGHGLGLATIHSIIARHKGTIQVDSRLGEGTVFSVCLPASIKRASSSPVVVVPSSPVAGAPVLKRRILVMDDEEIIRDVLKAMLHRMGFGVAVAPEGRAALELFRGALAEGDPFVLVMVDLTVIGGWGGQQTALEIKAIEPSTKIIATSGYATDPIFANFQKYGFSGILPKPFLYQELRDLVEGQFVA